MEAERVITWNRNGGGQPPNPVVFKSRWKLERMLGRSAAMERLFLQIRYLSRHLRVGLIEGERGTGKRLVAETLHGLSAHRDHAFISCGAAQFLAAPAEVLSRAANGTLFLAGVDTLDSAQQTRMAQFLAWFEDQAGRTGSASSHGSTRPAGPAASRPMPELGEHTPAPRMLLAGSYRALHPLVLSGRFHAGLQRAVGAISLLLPPLRDRREDLPLLVDTFLAEAQEKTGKHLEGVAPEVLPALAAEAWPGNVRELRDLLFAAVTAAPEPFLRRADLGLRSAASPAAPMQPAPASHGREGVAYRASSPTHSGVRATPSPLTTLRPLPSQPLGGNLEEQKTFDPNLDRAIARHIRLVLNSVGGNKLRAARLLGISRSTLYRLLEHEEQGAEGQDSARFTVAG